MPNRGRRRSAQVGSRPSSREGFLHLGPEPPLLPFYRIIGGWVFQLLEIPENPLLVSGQILRRPNANSHQLITPTTSVEPREPLSPQAKDFSCLDSRRNSEADSSLHRGDLHYVTQGSLAESDGEFVEKILPVSFEPGIILYLKEHDDVPFGAASGACISLAA